MKCKALYNCQARVGKHIKFFHKDQVHDFEKVPEHFESIERSVDPETNKLVDPAIDFDTAGEEVLLEAEYDDDSLKEYLLTKYGIAAGNRKRGGLVALLLDARFKDINV